MALPSDRTSREFQAFTLNGTTVSLAAVGAGTSTTTSTGPLPSDLLSRQFYMFKQSSTGGPVFTMVAST